MPDVEFLSDRRRQAEPDPTAAKGPRNQGHPASPHESYLDEHATSGGATYLTARQVRGRYAVSDMTIWRWLQDEKLGFPQPMVIRRRRLWKLLELVEWERRQAAKR